tara:strand:- start:7714 stop:8112 length:399 start_codon:yes stop_codon:yes gene_type:complete
MSGTGQLQDYSVDQAAGAVVLVLGAVASLLLVIWQSKCHCKMNLCWIFQCERRPPSEEEMKTLKEQVNDKKQDMILKKEDKILDKEDKILKVVKDEDKILKGEQLVPTISVENDSEEEEIKLKEIVNVKEIP